MKTYNNNNNNNLIYISAWQQPDCQLQASTGKETSMGKNTDNIEKYNKNY
jgi:hypothetical protein